METDVFDNLLEVVCAAAKVDTIEEVVKHPLINEDGTMKDGDEGVWANREGFPGTVFFKAKNKEQPKVYSLLDADGDIEKRVLVNPEDIADTIKSGDYGFAVVDAWAYRPKEVTFFLKEVYLAQIGEPLGGPSSKELVSAAFTSGASGGKKQNGSLSGLKVNLD